MNGLGTRLRAAADALDRSADELTRLDSIAGDGDLGRTAGLIARSIRQAVDEDHTDAAALLQAVGAKVAAAAASSCGTLVATGLLGAARAVEGRTGAPALRVCISAAVAAIERRGGARPGDRTMLDALVPALQVLEDGGADLGAVADALETGAEATRNLEPAVGRARILKDRAKGHPDAGAVLVACALGAALRAVPTD